MTEKTRQPHRRSGSAGHNVLAPFAVALAVAALSLAGCETVTSAYRGITGASKDDPGPGTRNTANLDAGSKQDYPNLASVPGTPVRGLTAAERQQLADGLIADRNNAHYTSEKIASGDASAVMPPRAPIPEDPSTINGPLPADNGPPAPPAEESKALPDTPATAAAAPPADTSSPAAELTSGSQLAGGSELTGPGSFSGSSPQPKPRKSRHRAPPQESALVAPQPREHLEPQTPEEAPPSPVLPDSPPTEQVAEGPAAPGSDQLANGGELTQHDVQLANAPQPQPVPAPPNLSPNPPLGASTATAPAGKRSASQVFEVNFPPGSNEVSGAALSSLANVPGAQSQHAGLVRVVSHAEIPTGGNDPAGQALASYQTALTRSQAVKQALIARGVPSQQIIAEVSTKEPPSNRVDVIVEY